MGFRAGAGRYGATYAHMGGPNRVSRTLACLYARSVPQPVAGRYGDAHSLPYGPGCPHHRLQNRAPRGAGASSPHSAVVVGSSWNRL